jgi:putative phage-type endonuclease
LNAIALPYRQGTPEWIAAHLDGVSSSQIPFITGNRPGLLTLWAIQTRLMEPPEPDPATQEMYDVGHLLEDDMAELYTRRTARSIQRVNRMLRHPQIEWAYASLDRRSAQRGERRVVELKWAPHRRWSEGLETVPASVQDQVQWQLFVTGYDVADVGVLEGSRFAIHEIGRDDDYIADLEYLARDYLELVHTGTRPDVDGSIDTHRTLGRLYPREDRDIVHLYAPDSVWDELAARYRAADAAAKEARAELSAVKAAVKALLTDAAGIESEPGGYRLTWKTTRQVDWEGVAREMDPPADLIAEHTHTDWKAVAETLRPRRKLIDAHASPTGPRRLVTRFRGAPVEEAQEAEQEEEGKAA